MRPHELNPLLLVCPWCGAVVGENCVTQAGERTTYPHIARTKPLGYPALRRSSAQDDLLKVTRTTIEEAL